MEYTITKEEYDRLYSFIKEQGEYEVSWDAGNDSTCVNLGDIDDIVTGLAYNLISIFDLPNATSGYNEQCTGSVFINDKDKLVMLLNNTKVDPEDSPQIDIEPSDKIIEYCKQIKEIFSDCEFSFGDTVYDNGSTFQLFAFGKGILLGNIKDFHITELLNKELDKVWDNREQYESNDYTIESLHFEYTSATEEIKFKFYTETTTEEEHYIEFVIENEEEQE